MRRSICVLGILLALAAPTSAQVEALGLYVPDVDPPDGVEVDVLVGYGAGVLKTGSWAPVRVRLRSSGGSLRGLLTVEDWPLDETTPTRRVFAVQGIDLAGQAAKTHRLQFRHEPGRLGVRILVEGDSGEVLFRKHVRFVERFDLADWTPQQRLANQLRQEVFVLNQSVPLYASLDGRRKQERVGWPRGMAQLYRDDPARMGKAEAQAVFLDPADLTSRHDLWGLDAVLVPEPEALHAKAATAVAAYAEWGGKVAVGSGRRGNSLRHHPLAAALPVDPGDQRTREGGLAAIDSSRSPTERTLVLSGMLKSGAQALVTGADGPLVSVWSPGKGRVAFLAFPLDADGFSSDEVQTRVLREALVLPTGEDLIVDSWGERDVLEQTTARPLREWVQDATAVFWMVFLILGFLVVAGPVDYLLWRAHRRTWLTWVLLVVGAVGFSALAFVLGRTGGESSLVAHQAAVLVPLDPEKAGEQDLLVEGLVCFGSSRYGVYPVELPAGLRVSHASMGFSPNPLQSQEDDGNPYIIDGSKIRVALGVSNPSPFRYSGRIRAVSPAQVRALDALTLIVTLAPGPKREVTLARGIEVYVSQLPPGEHTIRWPKKDKPTCEGQSFTMTHAAPYSTEIPEAMVSACMARIHMEGDASNSMKQLIEPSGRPARIDASDALAAGARMVLVRQLSTEQPIPLKGPSGEVSGRGWLVYRYVVESTAK